MRYSRQVGCGEASAIFGVVDFERKGTGASVAGEKGVSDFEPPLTNPFTGKHYARKTTSGWADGKGTRYRFHGRMIERHIIFELEE